MPQLNIYLSDDEATALRRFAALETIEKNISVTPQGLLKSLFDQYKKQKEDADKVQVVEKKKMGRPVGS